MKKPQKVRWLTYYVGWPIRDFIDILVETAEKTWIRLKGGWYCEYCNKIHGRRVYKYKLMFLSSGKDVAVSDKYELMDISDRPDKYVCSLGRDAVLNEGWRPTNITLGDKLHSALSQIGEAFKGGM